MTVGIRGLYPSTSRTDTLRQEVVQTYLSDTASTRFGQGWQLAELSRLSLGHVTQGSVPTLIWMDGDGSYSVWRKVGGVWTGPPGETTKLVEVVVNGSTYVAYLDNGASIGFDAQGRQIWTADLIGNRTRFVYVGTTSRLDSIVDPAGLAYKFVYSARGLVSDVWLRGTGGNTARVMTLGYDPTLPRLTTIKVWRSATEGDSTRFHYLASTSYGAYVDSIYDPRHTTAKPIVTAFDYDTLLMTPVGLRRPPANNGVASYASFRDAWRRALPRLGRGRRVGSTLQMAERTIFINQLRGTALNVVNRPTDFTVDPFGGPTWVRAIAPEPIMGQGFSMITFGGDDIRHIARDGAGRVVKVVQARDSAAIADSIMYTYGATNNRVERIVRVTRRHPTLPSQQLDTLTFTWGTVTLGANQFCTRLTLAVDEHKAHTRLDYGTSGVAQCLPTAISGPGPSSGNAPDTTKFWYGPLTLGHAAGVRPVKVRDPNGVVDSMVYDAVTWNSSQHVRPADGAVSRAFYGPYGWADSTINAAAARTRTEYDVSGRPVRAKTGTGVLAPTVATFYNAGGLVDATRVYASNDFTLETPIGPVDTTRTWYDRLGRVDSTHTPGGRSQRFALRDAWGTPVWEFHGNGAYTNRISDWAGRLAYESQSAVGPYTSGDGRPFAEAAADSVYRSFGLGMVLSLGQVHRYEYTNKGQVARIRSRDLGSGDSLLTRSYGYAHSGALIADTLRFWDGPVTAVIVRAYEYNRRGQRVLARTTITGVSVSETEDSLRYVYDSLTGRLDSVRARVKVSGTWRTFAGVRWLYDRGGRDTLVRITPWYGSPGWSAGRVLHRRTTYDAAGRVSYRADSTAGFTGAGVWYRFSSPVYNRLDHLVSAATREPASGGGPGTALNYTYSYLYDSTGGTWRLLTSTKNFNGANHATYGYLFDVFGNELRETRNIATDPNCTGGGRDTSYYAGDNTLRRVLDSCSKPHRYWSDYAGNRLVQLDTSAGGTYLGPQSLLTYTARSQLFFSMTWTAQPGTYDYNWHYYDAAGRRVITHRKTGPTWVPFSPPSGGFRTYYVYDGADVALTLVKSPSGSWWVRARYLTGGLDQQLAGRFALNESASTVRNLALVADRQGTVVAAMREDGSQEVNASFFSRDPYGQLQGATGTGGSLNPEAGFAGASTPNASGGFVYLRNRWYDPQTGRFLTQDPIGLAGGVNLYSYAGNNPVAYTDPFGLCPEPEVKDNTLCVSLFIKTDKVLGGLFMGDDRNFSAYNPRSRASVTVNLDQGTASATVSQTCNAQGNCAGPSSDNTITVTLVPDIGTVTVDYHLQNGFEWGPLRAGPPADGSVTFAPNGSGGLNSTGNRDAYPSLEAVHWRNGQPSFVTQRPEGSPLRALFFFPNDRW